MFSFIVGLNYPKNEYLLKFTRVVNELSFVKH